MENLEIKPQSEERTNYKCFSHTSMAPGWNQNWAILVGGEFTTAPDSPLRHSCSLGWCNFSTGTFAKINWMTNFFVGFRLCHD